MSASRTRTTRRDLTKAQNRDTILAAARSVFAEMGFAAASVRDIIRATPLASGTFYNYFKSKEDVYQALRDDAALAIRPRLREARRQAKDAREFLDGQFRAFFTFALANRGLHPASETSRFRMDTPEVFAGFAELREDIEAAVALGVLPPVDPARLTEALTGVGFEVSRGLESEADIDGAAQFATALFLGGMGMLAKTPASEA